MMRNNLQELKNKTVTLIKAIEIKYATNATKCSKQLQTRIDSILKEIHECLDTPRSKTLLGVCNIQWYLYCT